MLWEGATSDLANLATHGKVASASYKITEDAVQFASGIVSSREETVPLWAVRDVDFRQTMPQKARGVADLHLKIDPAAGVYGQDVVALKSIRDAKAMRDLILRQANTVRNYWNQSRQEMEVERRRASASQIFAPAESHGAPAAPRQSNDLMAELTKLRRDEAGRPALRRRVRRRESKAAWHVLGRGSGRGSAVPGVLARGVVRSGRDRLGLSLRMSYTSRAAQSARCPAESAPCSGAAQPWNCAWCNAANDGYTKRNGPATATLSDLAAEMASLRLQFRQRQPGQQDRDSNRS